MSLPTHEFFRPPTRVSRLYPVLSLVLLLVGSGTLYRWQITQINADTAVQQRDKKIQTLTGQLATLTTQEAKDQTTLSSQAIQLKDTTDKLQKASADLVDKEKSLTDAQAKLKQQQDQLSSNATELQQLRSRPPLFSFQNTSNLPDAAQKEADIKELVTNAYDYIQQLYGQPYLLNQITITFVNQFTIAGAAGEITIQNGSNGISIDIHLKDFDKNNFQDNNTMIHEMLHGFHGVAVMKNSALEEGMTVAGTDAVMEKMIADGKLPHFSNLYIIATDNQYQDWNKNLLIPADNSSFYASNDIAKIYQVIGYAWMKFYREDPNFFKELNEMYYAQVQKGEDPSLSLITTDIEKVLPYVGATPSSVYISQNQAFNPS